MSQRLVVLVHALVSTAGALAEYAIGLIVSIIIARTLGPAHFGAFSYTIWVAGTLFFFCNHGVSVTAIRFTADARGQDKLPLARAISHWLGNIQIASMAAVLLVFVATSWVMPPKEWVSHAGAAAGLVIVAVLAKSRSSYLMAVAQGHQKFLYSAIAPVVLGFTYLLGALVVMFLHPTVWAFLCAYTASNVAGYVAIAYLLRRGGLEPRRGELEEGLLRKIKLNLWLTAGLALLGTISNRTIETFVLSSTATAHDIGFFAIAGTLTKGAVDILTAGLQATLMPVLAHSLARRGPSAMGGMINTAIRYYWFLGLTVAGVGGLAARSVVLVVYGQPFAEAIPAIQLTMLGAGLGLVASVIGASLTTQDHQGDRVKAAALSVVGNGVVAIALVPTLGLIGAAITFGVSRVITALLTFAYFKRTASFEIQFRPCVWMGVSALISACAGTAAYVALPPNWGGFVAAAVFLVILVPLCVVLKCWTPDDYVLATGVLKKLGVRSERIGAMLGRLSTSFARQEP
jgi:O-antigen/teichoic acid export membrane protein